MQRKDIPDQPILDWLAKQTEPSSWVSGTAMPCVLDAMPEGTPDKLALAKMNMLIRRGLVAGCACGCRGEFVLVRP